MAFTMPRPLWTSVIEGRRLARSDFREGDLISQKYSVIRVLSHGRDYQLLKVNDVALNVPRVVKVLERRCREDGVIERERRWLSQLRTMDSRRAEWVTDFRDPYLWYFVFNCARLTLRGLFDGDSTVEGISRRQIREITLQLISAVRYLHGECILPLDICPDHIEFVHDAVRTRVVYKERNTFVEQKVLWSAQIRFAFYGLLGERKSGTYHGTDQYRAPEILFKWAYRSVSDNFSIGCVLAEMITSEPLFVPCEGMESYEYQKALMFTRVLGEFYGRPAERLLQAHPGWFDAYGMVRIDESLCEEVKEFIDDVEPLHVLIRDDEALELVEGLTRLCPRDRLALDSATVLPFLS